MSDLHAGRELEVGDANIVVATVQKNVGLSAGGRQQKSCYDHCEAKNVTNETVTHQELYMLRSIFPLRFELLWCI